MKVDGNNSAEIEAFTEEIKLTANTEISTTLTVQNDGSTITMVGKTLYSFVQLNNAKMRGYTTI